MQKYAANQGGSGNLPKAAQTAGTPDNAATAKGWQLFGKCTAEYVGLAEVADGQLADLHEWRAYGRVVQFLSCLCGRNQMLGSKSENASFLSCLCGRNRAAEVTHSGAGFLSCLCGRNPVQ